MTRKYYKAMAECINYNWRKGTPSQREILRLVVASLIGTLAADNPRFSAIRFRAACFRDEVEPAISSRRFARVQAEIGDDEEQTV